MYNIYNASVLYVSRTGGDDRNCNGLAPQADGFGNGPFRSLHRALSAVRDLRVTGCGRPLTIRLTEDCYLDRPLAFADGVSGVTLESYGARKRIIGGIRVTGWKRDVYRGTPCLSAALPEAPAGKAWDFTDFFVNGKRAEVTRYPKEGTFEALDTEQNVTAPLFSPSRWFVAKKEDLAGIEGIEDAIVNFYHWWIDEHSPVEDYDAETGKLVLRYASRFAISTQYGEQEHTSALHYYLTNVPALFSRPNEWYLDRKAGIVYYIPEDPDADPDTLEAFAPVTDALICVREPDIRIRNLELMCTRGDYVSAKHFDNDTHTYRELTEGGYASDIQSVCWAPGAIRFEGCVRGSVSDCSIHGVGVHAIEIRPGCRNIRIEGNTLDDLCAGGVKIWGGEAGCAPEQVTSDCIVRGNTISRCGRRYAAGCGVLVCHASNIEISDNEIRDTDYSGISVGWVWGYKPSSTYGCVIRGNHIWNIGMGRLSDMGGIYLLGRQRGTVVARNRIHDVHSAHYGGWGLYTDEGSSHITIEENVVYNTKTECMHQHYGSENVVRNNIFAFGSACFSASKDELHDGVLLEGNIFLTRGTPVYSPRNSMFTMTCRDNLVWDIGGSAPLMQRTEDGKAYSLADWTQRCGKDAGTEAADPGFADAEHYDFSLSPDSPAVKRGFRPLTGFLATGKRD